MNKAELIDAIADKSGIAKSTVDEVIKGMTETIESAGRQGRQDLDPGLHLVPEGEARRTHGPQPAHGRDDQHPGERDGQGDRRRASEEQREVGTIRSPHHRGPAPEAPARSMPGPGSTPAFAVSVPWNPSHGPRDPVLVAIVMLAVAAFAVGVSGWILLARDRRLRHSRSPVATGAAGHHEVHEER